MATLLTTFAVVVFFGGVMVALALATRHRLGRRAGASVAGPFEELWHPAAHRARMDVETEDERAAEAPAPGDPLPPTPTSKTTPPTDR